MKTFAEDRVTAIPRPEALLEPPAGAILARSNTDRDRRRMLIGLTQLQRVLCHMHGLPASSEEAVLNRIKYLVKTGFPRRYETVKGGRTTMGIDDALKLVVAFELFALGVMNAVATDALRSNWRTIGRSIATAWTRGEGQPRKRGTAEVLVVNGRSLLRENDAADGPSLTFASASARRDADESGPTAMVIDVDGMLSRFAAAVADALVATPATLREEMNIIAAEATGKAMEKTEVDA